jgi:hypothetical protein
MYTCIESLDLQVVICGVDDQWLVMLIVGQPVAVKCSAENSRSVLIRVLLHMS